MRPAYFLSAQSLSASASCPDEGSEKALFLAASMSPCGEAGVRPVLPFQPGRIGGPLSFLTASINGHPNFAYPYFGGSAEERGAGAPVSEARLLSGDGPCVRSLQSADPLANT